MKTAVIGLGLIGGSIAKAYKSASLNEVYGYDKDPSTLSYAKLSETIDDVLTDELLTQCELVFIALYPGDTVDFLQKKASYFRKGAVVIDTCGVKRGICEVGFDLAKRFGFTFVGGHPMAGTQFSGIKHSRADLFNGASMIIVPPDFGDIALLDKIKHLLFPLQLGKITISTAEHHDDVIAYTSQLAHIVSSAYIKNKNAENHVGFSAGSYKDMTRVATLNEKMWTELFLLNKDNLAGEIDELISSLSKYSKALKSGDEKALYALLSEGTARKCQLDG